MLSATGDVAPHHTMVSFSSPLVWAALIGAATIGMLAGAASAADRTDLSTAYPATSRVQSIPQMGTLRMPMMGNTAPIQSGRDADAHSRAQAPFMRRPAGKQQLRNADPQANTTTLWLLGVCGLSAAALVFKNWFGASQQSELRWAMMATTGVETLTKDLQTITTASIDAIKAVDVDQVLDGAKKVAAVSQVAVETVAKVSADVIQSVDVDQVVDTAKKVATVSQVAAKLLVESASELAVAATEAAKSVDVDETLRTATATAEEVSRAVTPLYQQLNRQAVQVAAENPWLAETINNKVVAFHEQAQSLRDQLPMELQPYLPDEALAAGGVLLVLSVIASLPGAWEELRYGKGSAEWDLQPEQVDQMLQQSDALLLDIRSPEEAEAGVPDLRRSARNKALLLSPSPLPAATRNRTRDPEKVERRLHAITVSSLRRVRRATAVIVMDSNGNRGRAFAQLLRDNGLPLVYYLKGGYARWRAEGLATRQAYDLGAAEVIKAELAALTAQKDGAVGGVNAVLNSVQAKLVFGIGAGAGLSTVLLTNF